MAKSAGGRPSLFRGKSRAYRVQGVLSDTGGEMFERVRKLIADRHQLKRVSDADVIEQAVRFYHGQVK